MKLSAIVELSISSHSYKFQPDSSNFCLTMVPIAFPLCPLVIILIFGHDTSTGSWSTRHLKLDTKVVDAQVFDKTEMANSTNEPVKMTDVLSRSHEDTRVTIGPQSPLMTAALKTSKESSDVRILSAEDEIPQASSAVDIWKSTFF